MLNSNNFVLQKKKTIKNKKKYKKQKLTSTQKKEYIIYNINCVQKK